jgi:hypothetical protein
VASLESEILFVKAANQIAQSIAIIVTTIINSTRVKAFLRLSIVFF